MNKRLFFVIALTSPLLFSCTKEFNTPVQEGVAANGTFSIQASVPQSKTAIDDTWAVSWTENDSLSIIVDGKATRFNLVSENMFTTSDFAPAKGKEYTWNALYPYTKSLTSVSGGYSDADITIPVANVQLGAGNNSHLAGQVLVGIAQTSGTATPHVSMKQTVSVIKVKLTNNSSSDLDIRRVVINNSAYKYMSGKFKVKFEDGSLQALGGSESYPFTELNVSSAIVAGGSVAEFYVPTAPLTLNASDVMTFTFTTADGKKAQVRKILSSDVEFNAGAIRPTSITINDNDFSTNGDETGTTIIIDGDFSDWAGISGTTESASEADHIKEFKFAVSSHKLYGYYRADWKAPSNYFVHEARLLFNTDGNSANGSSTNHGMKADVCFITNFGNLNGAYVNDWGSGHIPHYKPAFEIKSVGDESSNTIQVEFSIDRREFEEYYLLTSDRINAAISAFGNPHWNLSAKIPSSANGLEVFLEDGNAEKYEPGKLISIDGAFEDWNQEGIVSSDTPFDSYTAIESIKATMSSKYLYVYLKATLQPEAGLKTLGHLHINVDGDNDATTGRKEYYTPSGGFDVQYDITLHGHTDISGVINAISNAGMWWTSNADKLRGSISGNGRIAGDSIELEFAIDKSKLNAAIPSTSDHIGISASAMNTAGTWFVSGAIPKDESLKVPVYRNK